MWSVKREDDGGGVYLAHAPGRVRLAIAPTVSPAEARQYALGILAAAMKAEAEAES